MATKQFPHEDEELFAAALVFAEDRLKNVDRALIEKDYWVTHTLFLLKRAGFEIHFKGGTSLSKGFKLIERFSEDLDLKLEAAFLPSVTDTRWRSTKKSDENARRAFFDKILATTLDKSVTLEELPAFTDKRLRNMGIAVRYRRTVKTAPALMREYVLLEVGRARVTPFVERRLSSWVHDELRARGAGDAFADNEPLIRCVHPLVTLFEKLEALERRADQDASAHELTPPRRYVRHYEDAAHIVRAHKAGALPALVLNDRAASVRELIGELVTAGDIARAPATVHNAFNLDATPERKRAIADAYGQLQSYYWGPRIALHDACAEIRSFIADPDGRP